MKKVASTKIEPAEMGFSLIELVVSLVITLIILGVAVMTFSSALSSRSRESSKTDAITSAQAALNIMSREIGNAGYGLTSNGIVVGVNDSTENRLHFRTNVGNNDGVTSAPGEDVTFYYDTDSQSVVRYDANTNTTSGIINRISDVDFIYWNYVYDPATGTTTVTQGAAGPNTGRVTIVLRVILGDVPGQPSGQIVRVNTDVTLRNSPFMLGQY